mgnify:FL=1
MFGAAKTSAYYAVNPFIGSLLAFVFLKEALTKTYLIALLIMLVGSVLVVVDTLIRHHVHAHQHNFTHTHGGNTHTHTVTHVHAHEHYVTDNFHSHRHTAKELEALAQSQHAR